jgi:hypothetical protein
MAMFFDEDDQIILRETEKYFMTYYDFLGEGEAFKLFDKFRQTVESIKDTKNRKALLNRKFVILRRELAEVGRDMQTNGTHKMVVASCQTSFADITAFHQLQVLIPTQCPRIDQMILLDLADLLQESVSFCQMQCR